MTDDNDDGTVTEAELRAMGIDPTAATLDLLAMPIRWDKLTATELAGFAKSTVEAAEELVLAGVPIPSGLRVDLIEMGGIDRCPISWRERAARLLANSAN